MIESQNQSMHCRRARQVVKRTYEWLAEQPEDADELAALLSEAAPRLGVAAAVSGARAQPRTPRRLTPEPGACLRQRLASAVPMPTGAFPCWALGFSRSGTEQHWLDNVR